MIVAGSPMAASPETTASNLPDAVKDYFRSDQTLPSRKSVAKRRSVAGSQSLDFKKQNSTSRRI